MARVLEKEVMTDPIECVAYAQYDKSAMIGLFMEKLTTYFPNIDGSLFCDIGCGNGDYYSSLCATYPNSTFVGYDASPEMLTLADEHIPSPKVNFVEKYIPYDALPAETYDGVISTMFLHQLPNPMVFWDALKQTIKPNGFFMMLDMVRVEDDAMCDDIVNYYVPPDQEVFAVEFKNSLKASFIITEISQQLIDANITATIEVVQLPNNFNVYFVYGRI
jgi:2-polyprenyl-3-methyl-5-hydroxy-6-metoxy-1,4-benzoquinol methylase